MLIISTQNFPPEIGGIGNLIYDLCLSLSAYPEPVAVFADHQRHLDFLKFDREQNFNVHRSSGIKPLRRWKKARDISTALGSHSSSPKLIADSWKSLEYVEPRPFSCVICLAHGTELPRRSKTIKSRRIKNSFSKADYVVANSHYTAEIVRSFVDSPGKIRVIHPGIMLPERQLPLEQKIAKQLEQYSPVLITIARLERRKGQHQIIQLLPELIKTFPDLIYVVVGDGAERVSFEKTAQTHGLGDHVLFTGSLAGPEKNAYLCNSDLFVMPGSIVGQDVEGFGMAYIEAAYFSIPSVACRVGGAPEAVIHDKTGLLCEPDRPRQLLEHITRLLRDKQLRHDLGANAHDWSKKFLWENKIMEYRQLLSHCR